MSSGLLGGERRDRLPGPATAGTQRAADSTKQCAVTQHAPGETRGRRAGAARFDARFVTWNLARATEKKVAAIERLIQEAGRPAFIALQEAANVSLENSNFAAVLRRHGYAGYVRHRNNDPACTHGGAALLVRSERGATVEPYVWAEADAWSAECETVSVRVTMPDGAFIVSSVYVHGSSADAAGFEALLASARSDQVLLGDMNAQLPGSRAGGDIAGHFKTRGLALSHFIERTGAMYPTPAGPTRLATEVDPATQRRVFTGDGTINDHIVVGCDVFARIIESEPESLVLPPQSWPSDHLPLVWSASIGLAGANDMRWCKRVAWHRVTEAHTLRFNRVFRSEIGRARDRRTLDMLAVETALRTAERRALPYTCPRHARDGLFWTHAAQLRGDSAAELHGPGARAPITEAYAAARRRRLAEQARLSPHDPTSVWNFTRSFYAFGCDDALRAPLVVPGEVDEHGAPRTVISQTDRVEVLGRAYAAVSDNPAGIDAQAELAAVAAAIPPPHADGPRARVSRTELRACIASFATGKCADFLGVRAEHLRQLDDSSLDAMIPFVDRCVSRAVIPPHWRTAVVSPVPKRKRDLTLVKSWRPVSVTAVLARLCEMVNGMRITHRLEQPGQRCGRSQFGYRRGVATPLALAGISMFIRDGQRQQTHFLPWRAVDENDTVRRGAQAAAEEDGEAKLGRDHASLLVSIDGSDAFCRALPAKAVQKLLDMGLVDEARWVAAFLQQRTLRVRDGDALSARFSLARGVPQGTILGPLLWSLVIDDLIALCEEKCKTPVPGCVVVPIVFADDINFIIRGFNPSSLVAQANALMRVVRDWAEPNGVPMGKLAATWITGGTHAPWAQRWTAADGEIVYDESLKVVPGVDPLKLLGVTFDCRFAFKQHVDAVLETCERMMKLLVGMTGFVSAEKLSIVYRALILSRMLYAVEVWYPFVCDADRDRLQQMHTRGCRAITGCIKSAHAESVCYEAGYRMFEELARDEIVKVADKLRRIPDVGDLRTSLQCFGVEWVARLFRDGCMPTASLRPVVCDDHSHRCRAAAVWPPDGWRRVPDAPETLDCKYVELGNGLRDIGVNLLRCGGRNGPRDVRTYSEQTMRPLARPHPHAPQQLAHFDVNVRFITAPPGGLIKPDDPVDKWPAEVRRQFCDANAARVAELVGEYGEDAVFIFTDGSRAERRGQSQDEACAGAFIICAGTDPRVPGALIAESHVPVSPIACVYTAELASIHAAFEHVLQHADDVFRGRPRRLVLVTDSRSSLESLRTTWLRRIDRREQEVCWQIRELVARHQLKLALCFVFSHVGGCVGNAHVDELAETARCKVGTRWADPVWYVDSTRRMLLRRHDMVDAAVASGGRFRVRHMPAALCGRPSDSLPRHLSRRQEKLIYRARLGMLCAAGGVAHDGSDAECPFCGGNALGRDGATMEHLVACLRARTNPPLLLELRDLWTNPAAAVVSLEAASDLALASLTESAASRLHHRLRHIGADDFTNGQNRATR